MNQNFILNPRLRRSFSSVLYASPVYDSNVGMEYKMSTMMAIIIINRKEREKKKKQQQRARNVETTSNQRRCNVMTLHRR